MVDVHRDVARVLLPHTPELSEEAEHRIGVAHRVECGLDGVDAALAPHDLDVLGEPLRLPCGKADLRVAEDALGDRGSPLSWCGDERLVAQPRQVLWLAEAVPALRSEEHTSELQ